MTKRRDSDWLVDLKSGMSQLALWFSWHGSTSAQQTLNQRHGISSSDDIATASLVRFVAVFRSIGSGESDHEGLHAQVTCVNALPNALVWGNGLGPSRRGSSAKSLFIIMHTSGIAPSLQTPAI